MSRPKATACLPDLGGKTPMERFERILKRVISAPKEEIDRRMAEERHHKNKRKRQRT
jgi:hypothetical protein